jgi:hypothetical protein
MYVCMHAYIRKMFTCLHAQGGAETVIEDCIIKGGRDAGVVVYDQGKGTLCDCLIEDNKFAGITVSKAGNPLVQR